MIEIITALSGGRITRGGEPNTTKGGHGPSSSGGGRKSLTKNSWERVPPNAIKSIIGLKDYSEKRTS